MSATLLTCSFRGDLEVCRLLCQSVDLYASDEFQHRLYVPAQDMAHFEPLASPRRRILPQESLLPSWFLKLPMPGGAWRRRLRLPRRNVYLTPTGFVRGWIAQQIMKIAASLESDTDIVAHIDSDAALLQPLRLEHLLQGGRARFYAGRVAEHLAGHALWYAAAARLTGLPAVDYYRAEYIAPLVVWRKEVVAAMTAQIAKTVGRPWTQALARTPHFSEYVLYGVFADHALGLEAAGLARDPESRCLTRWLGDFDGDADVGRFLAAAGPDVLVCCLQSTLALSARERARAFEQAAGAIEAQARETQVA